MKQLEFVARRLCSAFDGDPDRTVLPRNQHLEMTRSGCSVVLHNFLIANYVTWLPVASEAIFLIEEWHEAQKDTGGADHAASSPGSGVGEERAEDGDAR